MVQVRPWDGRVRLAIGLGIGLLVVTTGGRAAPAGPAAAPDGPAEHLSMLKLYLKAFSAGELEGLRQFAADHLSPQERHGMSPEQVAQFEISFRRMVGGGFDLYQVEKNSDAEMVAVLKGAGEFPLFARLAWRFDPARPNSIVSRDLQPVDAPAGALGPPLPADQLAKEVDAKLSRMAAEDQFSGAVLIARAGEPIWQKAYGFADREAKIPNTLGTRFRLGSMNKMFTAVAIAQLVQAGKLKYTDTVAQLLPDYPNPGAARKITVHQLLTHTSGLGDIFGPEFDRKRESLHLISDYLPLFAQQPLRFEPGTRWAYSNAGFIVLGLIIERVSGQSYYDDVQQHIYDVAGMKASGSFPTSDKVPNLAVGYMRQGPDGPLVPNWATLPWRGMSAGGGDSTVGDLLRFDQALRGHRLLSKAMTDTVITGKVQTGGDPNKKYAYGFEDSRASGRRIVGHSGGAPGMNAELDMDLDGSYTVVVLANMDPPVAQRVAGYLRSRLK